MEKQKLMSRTQSARRKLEAPAMEILNELADKLQDGKGGWRDQFAGELRNGHVTNGDFRRRVICYIFAIKAGSKYSDAYYAEWDRVYNLLWDAVYILDEVEMDLGA